MPAHAMMQLEQIVARRLDDPPQTRSERARGRTVRHLHLLVATELRGLSAEAGAALLLALCNRCVSLLHGVPTRPLHTQLGALELLDLLLDLAPSGSSGSGSGGGGDTVLIRVANAVRLVLQQHVHSDPALLHAAASVLGHLARLGSPLTFDLVTFQAKQAFEWLQQSAAATAPGASQSTSGSTAAAEQRQLAAVLVLKQLAASAPTLFNTHAPLFFDLLGGPMQALRVDVREAAVLALRVCLVDATSRAERWKRSCWLKIWEQAQEGLQTDEHRHARQRSSDESKSMDSDTVIVSPRHSQQPRRLDPAARTARIHGSLLLLGELLKYANADFMAPRFRTVTDLLMVHRSDPSKIVQRSVLTLIPRAAKLNPGQFERDYLADAVAYISSHMEADQRDTAFLALGRLAEPMADALLPVLPPLVAKLATSLSLTVGMLPSTAAPPSSTKTSSFFGFPFSLSFGDGDAQAATDAADPVDPHADRNWSYRRFTYAAMTCLGQLAEGLGEQLKAHVEPLLDGLMQTGLSQSLVDTLDSIGNYVPSLLPLIQDRLFDQLSHLLSQAWSLSPQQRSQSHHGSPSLSAAVAPAAPSSSYFGFKSAPAPIPVKQGVYSAPAHRSSLPTLPDGRVPMAFMSPSSRLGSIRTPAEVAEHDRAAILLALRSLSSFSWHGQEAALLAMSREVVLPYLRENEEEIRLQAAVTMAELVRTLAATFVHTPLSDAVFDLLKSLIVLCISDPSATVRLHILSSLASSPAPSHAQRHRIMLAGYGMQAVTLLHRKQQTVMDTLLCQSELLSSLALCLNDESFAIRERALALLSSMAPRNPIIIQAILRSFLLQLLHSLQHQSDDMDDGHSGGLLDHLAPSIDSADLDTASGLDGLDPASLRSGTGALAPTPLSEQNAKLLLTLISYPGGEKLCCSYAHAILQVLLPKLTHVLTMHSSGSRRAQPALLSSLSTTSSGGLSSLPRSSQLTSYILSTLGKLSILAGADMRHSIALLLQLIIETLHDQSSGTSAVPDDEETVLRRTVAIRTLGQLITSTGNVIEPYMHYPSLLPTLLMLLQDDRTGGRIAEGARNKKTTGLLGMEDPNDTGPQPGGLQAPSHQPATPSFSPTRSSQRVFRLELLKLLAKLGVLNPTRFRHSAPLQAIQAAEAHHHVSLTGAPPSTNVPGLGSVRFLDTEPQLADLMAQAEEGVDPQTVLHETYFPTVALRALLRILLNSRLAHLHVLVLRAILFIFRSLGAAKVALFLPSIMPLLLHEMAKLATQSMTLPVTVTGPAAQLYSDPAHSGAPSPSPSPGPSSTSMSAAGSSSDIVQLQLGYLQHLTAITRLVGVHMRSYLPELFAVLFTGHPYAAHAPGDGAGPSLQLPYWSEPALTSSILQLIEVVSLSMRAGGGEEEFKLAYLPLVVSRLLQLLQHCDHNLAAIGDSAASSSSPTHLHPAHATHVLLLKVLHTTQVLGGSGRNVLEEFLHSLLPTLLRILERTLQQLPREPVQTLSRRPRHSLPPSPRRLLVTPPSASTLYQLSVGVVQTLSVLVYLHDCRLHASRLIHVLSRFFHSPKLQPSSLTEACLQLLCGLMTQQGFEFLLFEQTLQAALRPLISRYEAHGISSQPPLLSATGSPQFAASSTQRKLSTSSSEGSLSLGGSPLYSARSVPPRRSPSAMGLSPGSMDSVLQLNYLQRFHGLLAQLKSRLDEVRGEKQPQPIPTEEAEESAPTSRRGSQPSSPTNLSSKDFFHLPLLEPLDVPVGLVGGGGGNDDSLEMSVNVSRASSFTDLASLSEHGSDTDGEGDGNASPAIHPVMLGPKKLRFSQSNLQRAWTASARSTRDDWLLWMRGLSLELLKESPSPSLRACSFLAQKYPALAQTLFHPAFLAVWPELSDQYQDDCVSNLELIFARGQPADPTRQSHKSRNVSPLPLAMPTARPAPLRSQQPSPSPAVTPRRVSSPGLSRTGGITSLPVPSSIITSLLGLCEWMEHMEASLPLSISLLGQLSVRCHAFATALHYQEIEFHQTSAASQLASIVASPSDVDLSDMPTGGAATVASTPASIQAAEATIESLISINNKLGQKAAADGILKLLRAKQVNALREARRASRRYLSDDSHADADSLAQASRQAQVLIKPIWFEKLERWEDALEAYQQRQEDLMQQYGNNVHTAHLIAPSAASSLPGSPRAHEHDGMDGELEGHGEYIDVLLGKMRCLRALGEWEQLASIAQGVWNRTDDAVVRRELCPLAAAAACKLNLWDSMEPLFLYFDSGGTAAAAAAATSPLALYRSSTGTMTHPGSELRHRFDSHYYHAIFLTHRARYDEARTQLDRAVEVLDPQLTALAGESYQRAYKSLLLLQRVGQLDEIIDFKQSGSSGSGVGAGAGNASGSLSPRQVLLQRMWSSRMLGGLSRGGEDVEAWSELLMQHQLLRPPNSPYYSEHNLQLYLDLCEICRKQALDLGSAATDVPLATTSLNGTLRRKKNPFLLRSERILAQLIGFSPLELLPDASGTTAGQVPSMLRLHQVMETTRPRTKLPHLLFSIYKNLYAQGYRMQAFHRLRDMVVGQKEGDVFSIALREALAPPPARPGASTGPGYDEYGGSVGTFLGVTELEQLKALCYIRLGRWQMSMLDESLSQRTASNPTDTTAPCTPYSPIPTMAAFTFSYPLPDLSGAATQQQQQQSSSHATFLSGAAQSLKDILDFFKQSTQLDPSSVRAWHEYAMLHSKVCTTWKFLLAPQQQQQQASSSTSSLSQPSLLRNLSSSAPPPSYLTSHIVAAIHAFFRSISLQPVGDNSLQDILRILALWFEFGATQTIDAGYGSGGDLSQSSSPMFGSTLHSPGPPLDPSPPATISAAMFQGINLIALDNWLTVIPQLIARIHVSSPAIRKLLLELLCRIGRAHPQAMVYPLTVASKSLLESRRLSALDVLAHMRSHSSTLVAQAAMVSTQLVRVAILYEEMWHEGLEEASRAWYSQKDFAAMMRILEPLHALLACTDGMSIREAAFLQLYGKELGEALDLCRKYERATATLQARQMQQRHTESGDDARAMRKALAQESRHASSYITRAWEVYASIFRRLHKVIATTHELELSDISPQLLLSRDLELAMPGSYRAGANVVRIARMEPLLRVIDSKQHPRRLAMLGSDGVIYPFLLKGHEDLRQDERVMQLFGLVNTLLAADHATSRSDLAIRRYSVVPLSPNSGLIEWVAASDPIHTVIKRYRDARKILLAIEQRLMLKHAPDYHGCTIAQRVEIFDYALSMTTGQDLARVMWLHAATAEIWLERRTRFTSSMALMSMVGYVLGLGDRHTCNILLSRKNAELVHCDFGDCFEVAMQRDKFPEKVPFRLTRMFVAALDVAGIDGAFRHTAERCMRVLRKNKNSIMAVLQAFSLDPLLNWRLLDVRKKPAPSVTASATAATPAPAAGVTGQPQQSPAALNNNQSQQQQQQMQQQYLLAPVAAPHSHVASPGLNAVPSNVVPVLAEHLLIAQGANVLPPLRNVAAPPPAPAPATSILGMLTQPTAAASSKALGLPPAGPSSLAAALHSQAEAKIVAGAAEPGFGPGGVTAGGVGALAGVDEGDEERDKLAPLRPMPPSPAPRRRSVVDESALELVRAATCAGDSADDGSRASHSVASGVVHSRLEQLNQQAQLVMARVEMKLKGTEFFNELNAGASGPAVAAGPGAPVRIVGFHIGKRISSDSSLASASPSPTSAGGAAGPSAPTPTALTVAAQVQRLIEEATSHVNLAQMYIGWCPFW